MKKNLLPKVFSILSGVFLLFAFNPPQLFASCPGSKDAHAYVDANNGNTYSDHPGLGFNTKWSGSSGQCGPINSGSKQTCFTKIGATCFAGKGTSGFSTIS